MAVDLVDYFEKERAKTPSFSSVSIYCEVDYPEPGYNIHSFGDRALGPDEKSLWARAGGVDAYFEFKTYGIIEHPDVFKNYKCEVMLNSLGSIERFALNERGAIGAGLLEKDTFLLHIYLGLDATQGLLDQMKIARDIEEHHRPFSIRFDLFNIGKREKQDFTSYYYSICRAYSYRLK